MIRAWVLGPVLLLALAACSEGAVKGERSTRSPSTDLRGPDSPRLVYVVEANGRRVFKPPSFRPPGGGVMRNVDWGSYGVGPAWGEGDWYGRRVPFQLNTIVNCGGNRAYLYMHVGDSDRAPPFPVSHCDLKGGGQRPPAG